MFSLWFSHDFPVFLVHDCSIFPGFLVPPQRSSRLAARRAFRCRRVWAAAVRSGTQYLRTVLGDARSEAGGDRRGPEGPGGEGISSEFHYNVGPPFGIAFSWFITPISLWFMVLIVSYSWGTYNELVNGVYKPTYNWGAPHCRKIDDFCRDCTTWKLLIGGVEYFYVSIYWEFHNPNVRTPSFFRGIETNEQTRYKLIG